jgi:hypothetical protein
LHGSALIAGESLIGQLIDSDCRSGRNLQLREIALKKGTSVQGLLGNAINMLFREEERLPIAKE